MIRDRLAELQAKHEEFCQAEEEMEIDKSVARFSNSEIQLDLCLHSVTQISKNIREITNEVEKMKTLQKNIVSNPLIDHKEVIRLEKTSDQIFKASLKVQKEIQEYRQEVVEMKMHKSHERLIKNHLNKLESDLTKARNDFRAAQVEYIEKTQKLHQREYDIMTGHDDDDPDDPNKIHTPLPAEFLGNYFVEAERIKMELREIKARDTQIKKIEESVTEVNQLFKEINALLMEQGEKIDTIEKCVEKTVNYVEEGNIQLKQARKYKDTTRKRKICCVGFLVAILTTICILVAMVMMLQNDEDDSIHEFASPSQSKLEELLKRTKYVDFTWRFFPKCFFSSRFANKYVTSQKECLLGTELFECVLNMFYKKQINLPGYVKL